MKTESMLVRTLAKLAISTDDVDREVLRKRCGHLLAELENDENLLAVPHQPINLMQTVSNVITEIGIPVYLKGYRCVREAIILAVNDDNILETITKGLYPTVAEILNTTPSRVERAIRLGVEIAWDRGDPDVLMKYFGNTVSRHTGKPTNSEFIAGVAEHIRLNYVVTH